MKKISLDELDAPVAKNTVGIRDAMPAKRKPKAIARSPLDKSSANVLEEDGYSAGIDQRWREQAEGNSAGESSEVTQAVETVSIREGLKDELLELLKQNLTIDVSVGDFTNPNQRTIEVKFDGVMIGLASFDVVQQKEYEG